MCPVRDSLDTVTPAVPGGTSGGGRCSFVKHVRKQLFKLQLKLTINLIHSHLFMVHGHIKIIHDFIWSVLADTDS